MSLNASLAKITDRSLQSLSMWRSLRELGCRSTRVTGSGLRYLHENCTLTALDLSGNGKSDARNLKYVWRHKSLRSFCVECCGVSDDELAPISELKGLRNFHLGGTCIRDAILPSIGRLRRLQHLDLSNTRISDRGVRELAELKHLETLRISFCSKVTDASIDVFCNLPKLRLLCVYETGLSEKGFRYLSKRVNCL